MAIDINIPSQVKNYANLAAFPATGTLKTIFIAEDTNKTYRWTGSAYVEISASQAAAWGTITGTLSSQTDLNTALSGKVPTSRTLTINGTTQDLSANRTFTISTGITIGSTAIASGVVGRVLFEGAGNVVQESSSLFWDATNNRLGIGTSSPLSTLDINLGAGSLSNSVSIRNSSSTGYSAITLFDNRNSNSFVGQWGLYGTSHPTLPSGMYYYNTAGGNIGFFTGSGTPSADIRMMLTASGNTLINTTTDAGFRLDVNGTARVSGTSTFNSALTVAISNLPVINLLDTLTNHTWQFRSNGGSLWFIANGANNVQFRTNGNVLIGTTNDAGFKLDVNGTARFNGNLTFQTTSWILDNSNAIMHRGGFNVESIAFNSSRMVFTDNNGFVFNGNNSAATLTASSIVDIQSTTKGFLPPRMTTTQKNAIATPVAGLMVYDTTLNVISYYNGSMWI